MPRKKKTKTTVTARKSAPTVQLDILPLQAQMLVNNYLNYTVTDETHSSMLKMLKLYKRHKAEVHIAILKAFKFLTKDKYKKDKEDAAYPDYDVGVPPSKARIKETKRYINHLAKRVWKK